MPLLSHAFVPTFSATRSPLTKSQFLSSSHPTTCLPHGLHLNTRSSATTASARMPRMAMSPHLLSLRRALLTTSSTQPSSPSASSSTTPIAPRIPSLIARAAIITPMRTCLAITTRLAKRMHRLRTRHRTAYAMSRMALSLTLACATYLITRTTLTTPLLATTVPAAPALPFRLPTVNLPPRLAAIVRPFTESFAVVFLSEFGDKSMFATALMAMKYSPFLVCLGTLAALTVMTFIACFLGQLMHYLPATVTHYSSIALFVFFGLQMILQARHLPNTPGGAGSERADAEEMVAEATTSMSSSSSSQAAAAASSNSSMAILAKVCSLIFVAEWCDRSMLATMALAASNNTVAVIGGATAANVVCTGMAVCAATVVASRISERVVALTAGVLFEVFAVFTYLEGPEG